MTEPDDSILPLLRERRAELLKDHPDADRCFALNEGWIEKLKRRPAFARRVAEGEIVLASYSEQDSASRPEPASSTPHDIEPRD